LFTDIIKGDIQLASYILLHATGYTDATGIRYAFQARSHVHSVAEDVAAVGDYVALMNANSEFNAPVIEYLGIARGHPVLDFTGASNGVEDARKLGQKTIACVFDNASAMLLDFRFNQFMTMGF
jgi:hypothetical protein